MLAAAWFFDHNQQKAGLGPPALAGRPAGEAAAMAGGFVSPPAGGAAAPAGSALRIVGKNDSSAVAYLYFCVNFLRRKSF